MSNNNLEIADYTIAPTDYKKAILSGTDLSVVFKSFKPSVEGQIIKIIHRYLAKYDTLYIKDTVLATAKELITNGVKANLKRLYFQEKELNINEVSDYRNGMESFKAEIFQSDYVGKLDESNLNIKVLFKLDPENLNLTIINNSEILDLELKKIQVRIEKAYKYNDISEVFDDVLDDSEGAGLGLMMSIMMMKNSRFKPGSYTITKDKGSTISNVKIPLELEKKDVKENIKDEIINEIAELPSFPENILQIKKLCENPESTVKEISDHILTDPGLTTSILKLANSAGYFSIKKVETIEEAVVKIGFKGVNALLMASGACSVMDSKYKSKYRQYDTIWRNSYKRAYYAQKITSKYNLAKINEIAYLSSLLLDIGKIVLLSVNQDFISKIQEITGNNDMGNLDCLEELSLGMSFSYLGSLISKKWNFSDAIASTIEYSKKPYMANPNYKPIVYTAYLSDCMVNIDNKKMKFHFIDEDVLEFFKLDKQEAFESLHEQLRAEYQPNS